ncbi:MAG TPA: hypothetical protein PLQ76_06210, partial [bacterium]|nr:hypothetical protein [bacterium]
LAALSKDPLVKDPVGRRIVASFMENTAENFFTQQRYDSAGPLLENCSKIDPDSLSCRFFLALVLKKWGKYNESLKSFEASLKLLNAKSLAGNLDSNDLYMYERIYMELNKPDMADKYRKYIDTGGTPNPANGNSAP